MMTERNKDRGAAAVEFALVLPLLLLVLCGIVDFGRALYTQITLTDAAREGARAAAVRSTDITGITRTAADPLTSVAVTVTACPATGSGTDAAVVATHQFTFITPIGAIADLFTDSDTGASMTLTGKGVMRCQG